MRRFLFLGVLFLTGCSTAPITGLMDCLAPSRAGSDPNYPPKPVDRDPLPERLPDPELPTRVTPTSRTPAAELPPPKTGPSERIPTALPTSFPGESDERILPP